MSEPSAQQVQLALQQLIAERYVLPIDNFTQLKNVLTSSYGVHAIRDIPKLKLAFSGTQFAKPQAKVVHDGLTEENFPKIIKHLFAFLDAEIQIMNNPKVQTIPTYAYLYQQLERFVGYQTKAEVFKNYADQVSGNNIDIESLMDTEKPSNAERTTLKKQSSIF